MKNKISIRLRNKAILIGYLLIIVLLTVLPLNATGAKLNHTYIVEVRLDYLLHFALYLPIVYLMVQHFRLWLAVLAAFSIAIGMETLQYLIPYRSFNINDLLANVLACILSLTFWLLLKYIKQKREAH